MRKWLVRGLVIFSVAVVVAVTLPSLSFRVSVQPEKRLVSIGIRTAIAAQFDGTMGNGEPIPQQLIEPTFSLGGPPIKSVEYNFNAVLDTENILVVRNDFGIPDIYVAKAKAKAKAKGQGAETKEEVALRIKTEDIQPNYEIWTLLSSFPSNDPVRNGQLLFNERIEKVQGKDYLVITLAYSDIYIYSLEPLRFTTRFNGLNAGPVTGEWWQ